MKILKVLMYNPFGITLTAAFLPCQGGGVLGYIVDCLLADYKSASMWDEIANLDQREVRVT